MWEHGDLDSESKEYQMAVHLFGAASSPGCANFGLKHLANQQRSEYPAASSFVETGFYVDNGLASVATVEKCLRSDYESTRDVPKERSTASQV